MNLSSIISAWLAISATVPACANDAVKGLKRKDSSRGFQVSSEISFLISARKTLPTSGQTIDVTFEPKIFTN